MLKLRNLDPSNQSRAASEESRMILSSPFTEASFLMLPNRIVIVFSMWVDPSCQVKTRKEVKVHS